MDEHRGERMDEHMGENVIIVSADSHAGVPKELWTKYLDPEFHDLLPSLRKDNEIYPQAIELIGTKAGLSGHPEHVEAHTTGWHGLHDPVLRLADMDREGIAAELIYLGDSRLGDMFNNGTNRTYPLEAWDAGARAWNRWAADNFGFAMDRFLVTAAIGPCTDMEAAIAELRWVKEHGFTATYLPGYLRYPDMPQLYEDYWEPFWAACAELDLPVVVHAGFGTQQGQVFPELEKIYDAVAEKAGSTEREVLVANADAVPMESLMFFNDFLNHNVDSRRPYWQLAMGGAFDRHPNLKLILTEIRLDWIPATLAHLDEVYEANKDSLPAKRTPSEYYHSNTLSGASFMHKAEVEMRDEIGLETIAFGRDFPHPEATWPHTKLWLRDLLEGIPEKDCRMILGENAIRFLGLDRERLAEIAKRIGPSIEEINGGGEAVPEELLQNFMQRGGYLKPAEGADKLPMVDELLQLDVPAMAGKG
jgi:predicted TIM-barrel fold metal-dependent hydrolase